MESFSFDEIWQAWQKEKQSSKLQQIPKNFYDDVFSFIKNNQSSTEIQQTTKENVRKMLANIYERRKQKILIYLAYNQALPQPAPLVELQLYNKLSDIIKKETLEAFVGTTHELLVLQDIPKVVLPSGKEVGPLEKEQTIRIDDESDENFLLNNSICKKL